MYLLRRYTLLAILVIGVELLLLFLFKKTYSGPSRIPNTFEQVLFGNHFLEAIILPDLFENRKMEKRKDLSPRKTFLEQKLVSYGLVRVKDIDSSISEKLKYATIDNFLHKNLYGNLSYCYLQKETAEKLSRAQQLLKKRFPFYSIIIFDGVRPLSIQKEMWDELNVPERMKDKYVSNPEVGSLHNYGCAVDVSLINEDGWEMDMGTPYDYFGELGHPIAEKRMLSEGKLTWRQYENRKLLRQIMTDAGFTGITTEWWHFNSTSLRSASERFEIVE